MDKQLRKTAHLALKKMYVYFFELLERKEPELWEKIRSKVVEIEEDIRNN